MRELKGASAMIKKIILSDWYWPGVIVGVLLVVFIM